MNTDHVDSALGALLGACIGDAAGATLEFLGRTPTQEEVLQALTLPGGGFFHLAPGQITDDGELTLCLAHALAQSKRFDLEPIARRYADWVRSKPFDIGNTTRQSLGCFMEPEWKPIVQTSGYAGAMSRAAHVRCRQSKANGSLMRATPLGIWGCHLKRQDLALFAREDSALSHPNQSCRNAVACYVIAISELIRNPHHREAAFQAAKSWATAHANEEVCQWLAEAETNQSVPYYPQAGFIQIGFTHAFRHLVQGSSFVEAVQETLSGGGDTDTNACIVGGLVGAACGAGSIPEAMKQAVLTCNTHLGKHPRPDFLSTRQIPELVNQLLTMAPT